MSRESFPTSSNELGPDNAAAETVEKRPEKQEVLTLKNSIATARQAVEGGNFAGTSISKLFLKLHYDLQYALMADSSIDELESEARGLLAELPEVEMQDIVNKTEAKLKGGDIIEVRKGVDELKASMANWHDMFVLSNAERQKYDAWIEDITERLEAVA